MLPPFPPGPPLLLGTPEGVPASPPLPPRPPVSTLKLALLLLMELPPNVLLMTVMEVLLWLNTPAPSAFPPAPPAPPAPPLGVVPDPALPPTPPLAWLPATVLPVMV